MKTLKIIGLAIQSLKPINYKTFDTAYYVTKNDEDMGYSDYCEKCIDEAVKKAKEYHLSKRNEIIEKYNQIKKTGYFKVGRKKIQVNVKYSDNKIIQLRRCELKNYRLKSKFSYEGHDSDFGGGLTNPCSCDNCGEYFTCEFTPDKEQANRMLDIVNSEDVMSDIEKWELEAGLISYEYIEDKEVKNILLEVANRINTNSCKNLHN
jgi:hypothetical protein